MPELAFSLTYLDRFKIKDKDAGLTEPSGLTLTHDGDGLWTVCDEASKIFRLSLDGELDEDESFDLPYDGLEGITTDGSGDFLYVVKEQTNKVIKLDIADRDVAAKKRLCKMTDYAEIEHFFADDEDDNKGLEGITWNAQTRTLFALKEGDPGLLIEISPDLETIESHRQLNSHNGFVDPRPDGEKVDFSGICYDASREAFWIVSDKAERVFLYDPRANRVAHSAPLSYSKNGEARTVKKAEGIAVDPRTRRLYVASDEEKRLYVFAIAP